MDAWTKEEMVAFKRSVFDNFEQVPFDNKEITIKFIDYLDLIGVEGENIALFFEEYDNANCTRKGVYERLKEYYSYHRIFFWHVYS